ncbi:hypothetical protein P7K49_021601 [Saguinus oedipus]|uniref:Uncharacterized protein n=1 Tax=Saguinus oedipus TaxID=9490 RepID=A0ABQ9UUU8_SAGOE|nr:hypothetical protein P7K49_021601 [Saguinus oedipus]
MVEQMHLNFMDEKDRIITAMYNEARARARSVPALFCPPAPCPGTTLGDPCPNHPSALSSRANRASLQQKQQWQKQHQPPSQGPTQGPEISQPRQGAVPRPSGSSDGPPGSPAPWAARPLSPAAAGGGRGCVEGAGLAGGLAPPTAPPPPHGPVGSPCLGHMSRPPASPGPAPRRPRRPRRHSLPPPFARLPSSSGRRCAALRCLKPGLRRGPWRSRPPRPAPTRRVRAQAMGLWLPPPPAPPG